METVTVKKGSTVESNFGTKHEVLADFKATVLDRQHVEPLEPYFICLNDGKFESGLEEPFADLGQGQAFFVNERDVVQAWGITFRLFAFGVALHHQRLLTAQNFKICR